MSKRVESVSGLGAICTNVLEKLEMPRDERMWRRKQDRIARKKPTEADGRHRVRKIQRKMEAHRDMKTQRARQTQTNERRRKKKKERERRKDRNIEG